MPVVVLIGIGDVRRTECAWLRDRLASSGIEVVLVDTTLGAAEVVARLHGNGCPDGALAIDDGDREISMAAMRALPGGPPKLLITGMDSGDLGEDGVALLHGVHGGAPVSSRVLANAADAITAMVTGRPGQGGEGPIIGATVAGATRECVRTARELLSILGYEVLVFRAAGCSYEKVAASGLLTAALDVTLFDLDAPGRLEGAVRAGIPQVVSLGGLDGAGSADQASGTMARTTPEEAAELGRKVAARLRDAAAPTMLSLPLRGLSSQGVADGPLCDPGVDAALFDAVREGLDGSAVEVQDMDTDINDPAFGRAMADHLHTMLTGFPLSAAVS